MFGRNEITLNRVYDRFVIREGAEKLVLTVNGDPDRMIAGLNEAQKMLKSITEDTTKEDQLKISMYFAEVLLGKEQAEKVAEFYLNDATCIINVCGKIFAQRISKKITSMQKKRGLR